MADTAKGNFPFNDPGPHSPDLSKPFIPVLDKDHKGANEDEDDGYLQK